MPRLSSEEGTATLAAWLVAEGDVVEKGTLVAELETDKATVELESPAPGRIDAIVVRAGTEGLKPGMLLARIAPAAAASASGAEPAKERGAKKAPGTLAVDPIAPATPATSPTPSRSPATPLARRLAESEGLALDGVKGSGVGGRIEKVDVERLARAAAPKPEPVVREEVGGATAQTEVAAGHAGGVATRPEGIATVSAARSRGAATPFGMPRPAVQLELRCEMDAVVAARARLDASRSPGASRDKHLTLNDFVLRAAALALRDVPEANLRRAGDGFHPADGVDVAVVVASDAGPQLVVLRDADRKGLAVLSEEIGARIEQARSSAPPEAEDPTASLLVTSFGRFGVESAHPMLPPEQVAVLAVGAVIEQPVVRGGEVAVASKMALNLAFDPGAAGGATMSRLLAAIRGHLEDPLGMML
ncbi:MAG: 2-oxo acid dehydrogenase subunit E2 [Deltaproteobacteria bacterium]|nr:2-oxo acid dehydrogenase subunit E2 [Deltaproteobacteria bacterium]